MKIRKLTLLGFALAFLAGANILGTVKASNGIVHVIDAVLLPPDE